MDSSRGNILKGIDVSSYQGVVPWHNLSDIDFGIIKVTESETYINPSWGINALNLFIEKKLRGFYYYSIPGLRGNTPEAEAAYFWSKIESNIKKGDIIACDTEKTNYPDAKKTSAWVYRSLTYLQKLSGFKPLLYSYPDFIDNFLTDPRLSKWPLWLAWYQNTLPASYRQWKQIALWQKGPGIVKGITGQVDIDVFFLHANELRAYGKP